MKKSTHKRLTAWLLTLALVVTLLPGMGMTALAAEDGGEGNGPPAVEVVAPEDESSGSDKTVGTPPSTEPKSTEEDKTTEGDAYRVPKVNVINYALSAGNSGPAA